MALPLLDGVCEKLLGFWEKKKLYEPVAGRQAFLAKKVQTTSRLKVTHLANPPHRKPYFVSGYSQSIMRYFNSVVYFWLLLHNTGIPCCERAARILFHQNHFHFFSQHNSLEITIGVLTSVMLTAALCSSSNRENQEEIRSSGSLCVGYLYAKGVRWTQIKSNIVTYTYLGMVFL